MAKRYSISPIQVIFPNKEYSEMEAVMFNMFIYQRAVSEEIKQSKQTERKNRKPYGK